MEHACFSRPLRHCYVLMAARAWGLAPARHHCSAIYIVLFFHGYAVEGIVEGTDGWTLALWAWALGANVSRCRLYSWESLLGRVGIWALRLLIDRSFCLG